MIIQTKERAYLTSVFRYLNLNKDMEMVSIFYERGIGTLQFLSEQLREFLSDADACNVKGQKDGY